MEDAIVNRKDMIVMKLLHYFITERNYAPIILQGADDEIWLENLDGEYQIIRIVSNYLHNDEQFEFDKFKAKKISKKISKKIFTYNMNILSIYTDLGDNVHLEGSNKMDVVSLYEDTDINKDKLLTSKFPDILDKLTFNEEGVELFIKITNDINKKNKTDAEKAEEVFSKKTPYITYALIAINVICFLLSYGNDKIMDKYCLFAPLIREFGEYYRMITCGFLHVDFLHIAFNMYALYILGPQIESYLGKTKFLIIYLFSLISGSLMSMVFSNYASVGASGAIFGLMGSLLAFGYHYRVFLGQTLKSQIIPLILFNLCLGFMIQGVDNFAHIGGLIGGFLITMALGVKYKSSKGEMINFSAITVIFTAFMLYMSLVVAR